MQKLFNLTAAPGRRKKNKTPEGLLTEDVRRLLKTLGVWHWKQHQGLGSIKGVSDIIGIWRGKFLAIELKAPRGVLSDEQIAFMESVRQNGGVAFMAKTLDDVIDGLGVRDKFRRF